MKQHKLLGVTIVIFLLISCQLMEEQKPVLQGSTCVPPCWYQITPGQNNLEDVQKLLPTIPIIEPASISWNEQLSILTPRVTGNFSDEEILLYIYFLNGQVVSINFSGKLNYSFEEAVELFGEPEYITAVRQLGLGRRGIYSTFGSADLIIVQAILSTKGVAFGYNTSIPSNQIQSEIRPEIELTDLLFYSPEYFEVLSDRGFFLTSDYDFQDTEAAMTPWIGYKAVGLDYPYAKHMDGK